MEIGVGAHCDTGWTYFYSVSQQLPKNIHLMQKDSDINKHNHTSCKVYTHECNKPVPLHINSLLNYKQAL